MQSVSLVNPQTLNLYAYCAGDPVNRTDPSGLGFFSFLKNLFRWIANLFRSQVAKKIAVRFVVSFVVSGGNFGVAIRSVLPDILRQLGLNPNPLLTPSWNPNLPYPISLGGIGSLSRYIILNFDDLTKDPEVLKIFFCLLMAAGWLLNQSDDTEKASWIVKKDDGKHEGVRWPWTAQSKRESWKGVPPKGALAITHTHPPKTSPRPSTTGGNTGKGDQGTADKIGMPVYVITRDAIWKAVPNAKKPELVVDGDWWKQFRKEKTKCN